MILDMVNQENMQENCKQAYEKAKALQDKLNAVITFVDPSEQLEHLPSQGKLKGVPIALKDNVNTKGILTTSGSKILSNYVPIYDATIWTKLKEAGAVCIAKASMDELAMGGTNTTCFTGAAHNPWDLTRMTAGSSGGSAALVAANVVPMAIGSDTGDSVRKPAAYCGVVGVKPTYGRISRYGIIPYASSLDHVGYFTRGVEDACLTLEVLAGRDEKDMTTSLLPVENYLENLNSDMHGKKIAILQNVIDGIRDQAVLDAFYKIVNALKEKGAQVDLYRFDQDLMNAILPTYFLISNCEATSNHSNLDGIRFGLRQDGDSMQDIMIQSRTKGFGSLIRRRFVIGSYGLFEENQEKLFKKAQKVRRLIVDAMVECYKEYDCIIAPACGSVATKLTESGPKDELTERDLVVENYMAMANFSGYPSMTVPMGFEDGLPLGINLTTKAFDEQTMFNIAKAIEEITGYKDLHVEVK